MRPERGTVTVELAAVLPLLSVALLLVAQVGLLVSQQLAVQHAAREGARAAAVWNDDGRARDAAIQAGALDPARAEVVVSPAERAVGDPVTVTVRYPATMFPLVARFVPDGMHLSASVVMRTERAPA